MLFLNKHFLSFPVLAFSLLSINFSPPSIAPYIQSRDGKLANRPNTTGKACRYTERLWDGWDECLIFYLVDHLVSTEMELICYTKNPSHIRTVYKVSNQCNKLQCTQLSVGRAAELPVLLQHGSHGNYGAETALCKQQLSLQHSANPNQLLACQQWDSD